LAKRSRAVAQFGSAPDWGSGGRGFKSRPPDDDTTTATSVPGARSGQEPEGFDVAGADGAGAACVVHAGDPRRSVSSSRARESAGSAGAALLGRDRLVPVRPTLVFDGDCGFCTAAVRFLERAVPGEYDVVPWQEADLSQLGLSQESCQRAVQWVGAAGAQREGAAAIAAVLGSSHRPAARASGRLLEARAVSCLAGLVYSAVAANRHRLPGGAPACGSRGENGKTAAGRARRRANGVAAGRPRP
jgi:predicted DCC family thiol-disulfide oxidoreductase YuxK